MRWQGTELEGAIFPDEVDTAQWSESTRRAFKALVERSYKGGRLCIILENMWLERHPETPMVGLPYCGPRREEGGPLW